MAPAKPSQLFSPIAELNKKNVPASDPFAGRNITVNALALGLVNTEMTQSLPEDYKATMLRNIPLGRFGTTEEIAHTAVFLLSDDAGYITAQVILVDGGLGM